MSKPVLFGVIGVVLGIVSGMIVMMSLHLASTFVYPLPDGVDFMSQEPENVARLNEWFGTLPAEAFVLAIACHGFGCMAGAAVATLGQDAARWCRLSSWASFLRRAAL